MDQWMFWLAWAMYLAIYPLGGGMLYRAWHIAVRRDLRFVADWRGRSLPDAERWAPAVLIVNLLGGGVLLAVGVAVFAVGLPFAVWTGAVGLVLWSYYFLLRVFAARAARGSA